MASEAQRVGRDGAHVAALHGVATPDLEDGLERPIDRSGSEVRGELLEASVADGLDRDGFDALMSEARASRMELISAACG